MMSYLSYEQVERERREWRKQQEEHQKKLDIEDLDGEINWAYSKMRIVEAYLEETIDRRKAELSGEDQKRLDKAIIITRTGMKMIKKVIKSRAPHINTAEWREESCPKGQCQ